jgi:hypothetical protein
LFSRVIPVFPLLALLIQLILAVIAGTWIIAFAGFVDETKRSVPATVVGKLLVMLCVWAAAALIGIALYVAWYYYFSASSLGSLPLGIWLPLGSTFDSLLVSAGLIYLLKRIGYPRHQ